MGLGLDQNELGNLFNHYWKRDYERRSAGVQHQGADDDYLISLVPPSIAKALDDISIKITAAEEAVSQLISENNARIEAQLKSKGIDFS
jgi:hypothetical protein